MRQHLRVADGEVGFSLALHRRNPSDLKEAIRHYSLSLAVSDRFLHHSLIRLTTLWFRLLQETATDLPAAVPEMRSIAAYQWYEVLQQLLTVAQHPSELLRRQVREIVGRVLDKYTEHVVWQVVGMLSVEKSAKSVFMQAVGLGLVCYEGAELLGDSDGGEASGAVGRAAHLSQSDRSGVQRQGEPRRHQRGCGWLE